MVSVPARHHEPRQTFKKANVSFLLEVVQHFLDQDKKNLCVNSAVAVHSSACVGAGAYLLDQYVAPVQDGDAKFKGDGHYSTKST